jgi:hypothetical protein
MTRKEALVAYLMYYFDILTRKTTRNVRTVGVSQQPDTVTSEPTCSMWTVYNWLRIGSSGVVDFLEHTDEPVGIY